MGFVRAPDGSWRRLCDGGHGAPAECSRDRGDTVSTEMGKPVSRTRGALRTLQLAIGRFSVLAVVCAAGAGAQAPRGSDTLSAAAVADSLTVLGRLSGRVRSHPADTSAWHELGMIAWALATRAKGSSPPPGIDATRLGRLADTSLRIAAELAPAT